MEKVYRLLPWLSDEQAVDWLEDMTATPLRVWDLWQLCEAGLCDRYINASGLVGIWIDPDGDERECTGEGYQKVIGRRDAMSIQWLQLEGKFWEHPVDQAQYPNKDHWETSDEAEACNEFYFKPSDIEALAFRMNGAAGRSGEAEVLSQELEQERAARQVAEPSPKSRNAYLRTIAALGYALIGGSSGQPHPDANAMLAALAAKGIEAPIKSDALAGYLKQAEGI